MILLKELLWILVSLIIAFLVQYVIISNIEYKYIISNTTIVFVAMYYTHIAMDLKNMFFINQKWTKYFLFAFNLFLFVFIVTRLQKIIVLYDNFSITTYSNSIRILDTAKEAFLIDYIHSQFLFFSIFCLVVIFVLNMKIIRSFWKGQII